MNLSQPQHELISTQFTGVALCQGGRLGSPGHHAIIVRLRKPLPEPLLTNPRIAELRKSLGGSKGGWNLELSGALRAVRGPQGGGTCSSQGALKEVEPGLSQT